MKSRIQKKKKNPKNKPKHTSKILNIEKQLKGIPVYIQKRFVNMI